MVLYAILVVGRIGAAFSIALVAELVVVVVVDESVSIGAFVLLHPATVAPSNATVASRQSALMANGTFFRTV